MKKLSLSMLSIAAISLSFILFVLRVISLFAFFDGTGYYSVGAPLPIIANVITVLAIIFFFIAALTCIKPREKINEPHKHKAVRYVAILPLSALVFSVVRTITELTDNTEDTVLQSNLIPIITVIASLVGIVFFFLIFFTDKQKIATVYSGLGALVFVFFSWMSAYFDFSSPINSTQRILFYISCAGAMLFIFNEICAIYGAVRSKFYYFSLFASILTIASSAIPSLIGKAANKFPVYFTLEEDIFFAALLVYATVRLVSLSFAKKNDSNDIKKAEESEVLKQNEE